MNKLIDRLSIASFSRNSGKIAREYGISLEINHSCISENLNKENIENTILKIKEDTKALTRKPFVLHGPFTEIVPASIDSRAVELGLIRLDEAYYICKLLKISKMVVHSGFIPMIYHADWHIDKSVYFWKKFMENKPRDFSIFIENVFDNEPYSLAKIVDRIEDDRIGVCLDIGHCNVYSKKELNVKNWIEILGDRIKHVHLHNNYGNEDSHDHIFKGSINIDLIMKSLFNLDLKGELTFTVESRDSEDSIKRLLSYEE